ncbi:glycosyltransferase family 2 protein [Mucilaginibacter aquaedulcis]|uniref:glycosyltransferase family 2 protein n=1 Tax=Mucilaginibacter aquaedulcis TaxID=1187081 RepID=UPI0025B5559F|nr:glycosyltransferase family 2 protein [Mucilaginibacter aquaedulcis]MDN3547734.1 glycosyltransferase family 2 protein [Mucilaginibacter aquaedulcis]
MIDTPKVAVVILNWNGVKYLKQFLPSVLASTWPGLDIVLGDNGSTDGSVAFVKENFPSVKIIETGNNYGFTGGYNRVLSQVQADYFILLNSDVEVVPGWIEPVIELMESDSLIATAAPKLLSYAQKDQFEHAGAAGGFIDSFGYPFCRGRMFYEVEDDLGQYQQSGEVFWASGASLFIKKKYWDEAGGFDEFFFAHMEEIDLCWRLKNMGYKVMYCAQSTVYHVGGGTLNAENPFKTYLNFRNNLLLLKKNLPFGRALFVILMRFWMDLLALLRFLAEGKRKDAWAVSRAHQNFVLSIFGIRVSAYGIKNLSSGKNSSPKTHHSKRSKNLKGMYQGSIVWNFFVKKKTKFTDLDQSDLL